MNSEVHLHSKAAVEILLELLMNSSIHFRLHLTFRKETKVSSITFCCTSVGATLTRAPLTMGWIVLHLPTCRITIADTIHQSLSGVLQEM